MNTQASTHCLSQSAWCFLALKQWHCIDFSQMQLADLMPRHTRGSFHPCFGKHSLQEHFGMKIEAGVEEWEEFLKERLRNLRNFMFLRNSCRSMHLRLWGSLGWIQGDDFPFLQFGGMGMVDSGGSLGWIHGADFPFLQFGGMGTVDSVGPWGGFMVLISHSCSLGEWERWILWVPGVDSWW